VNSLQLKILDLIFDKNEKMNVRDLITSSKFMSMLSLGTGNIKNNMNDYDGAIAQAKKIITEIDKGSND
jgi:hypothetical protein